jgi:hypothetical protein
MQRQSNPFLVAGAVLTGMAALMHFACIVIGAPAFRFLGAGEQLASMAERGHWYPDLAAFVIGTALSLCSAYALSAARLLPRFPLARTVLCLATGVFLLRAIAFPLLKPAFPDNSNTFWLVTSGICLAIGVVHLVGLRQVWALREG